MEDSYTFILPAYEANTMATFNMMTLGARASVAIVLSYVSRNIPVSAPEGLNFERLQFHCVSKCVLRTLNRFINMD